MEHGSLDLLLCDIRFIGHRNPPGNKVKKPGRVPGKVAEVMPRYYRPEAGGYSSAPSICSRASAMRAAVSVVMFRRSPEQILWIKL